MLNNLRPNPHISPSAVPMVCKVVRKNSIHRRLVDSHNSRLPQIVFRPLQLFVALGIRATCKYYAKSEGGVCTPTSKFKRSRIFQILLQHIPDMATHNIVVFAGDHCGPEVGSLFPMSY